MCCCHSLNLKKQKLNRCRRAHAKSTLGRFGWLGSFVWKAKTVFKITKKNELGVVVSDIVGEINIKSFCVHQLAITWQSFVFSSFSFNLNQLFCDMTNSSYRISSTHASFRDKTRPRMISSYMHQKQSVVRCCRNTTFINELNHVNIRLILLTMFAYRKIKTSVTVESDIYHDAIKLKMKNKLQQCHL